MLNSFGNCVGLAAVPVLLTCPRSFANLVTSVREKATPDLQILQDAFRHFAP